MYNSTTNPNASPIHRTRVRLSQDIPLQPKRESEMDRPEVFDALMRIRECLLENEIAQEHTKAIGRHDLERLTKYIIALESVMDEMHTQAQELHILPYPWRRFEVKMEEIESR